MRPFPAQERDQARLMSLDASPASRAAIELVANLASGFALRFSKRNPSQKFIAAVGALVGDLLRNAESDRERWGYRSLGHDSFTGERVGARVFIKAVREMEAHALLELNLGHQQWTRWGTGPRTPAWARSTRFRGADWLFRLAKESGIVPGNWAEHFDLMPPASTPVVKNPLVCRRSTVRTGRERYRGADIPLDFSDPRVARLHAGMVELNGFLSNHTFGNLEHRGFRRIFNEGEELGYLWNKGGRLYSLGGGYQGANKVERAGVTIDGEPVVEIDIRASQLTILHALRKVAFDTSRDPFLVNGLPRDVVKAWVMMTLGHYRFHARWPKLVKERLEPRFGCPLQTVFPLAQTREAILLHLPVLRDWGECSLTCFDLQFVESEAVIGAVETLAFTHGVPSFPVHDSILVPASRRDLAERVLAATFEAQVGTRPYLTVG